MILDDLNGQNVILAEIRTFYGTHRNNFNEDILILSAAKCRPMILVSRNIRNIQCESKNTPMRFSDIFPKRLGIFSRATVRSLYCPIELCVSTIFIDV